MMRNDPSVLPLTETLVFQLLRNRAYWILLLCFGSGIGIFTCFSTLLEQILCVKGYSNVRAHRHTHARTHTQREK